MIDALYNTLSISGIIWVTISIISYIIGLRCHRLSLNHPVTHPLIITASLVGLCLFLSQTPVSLYQQSASLLHWFLGPVTVALALPIYRQWQRLQHYGWRLFMSIAIGGVIAPLTAWWALYLLNAPLAMQMTMLAKSITTPLAIEATSQIGGIPELAAVFVITTGIVGAIVSSCVFTFANVTDRQAQGIALGTVAHAVGTAKAIQMGDDVAAMATLGLCVNGILTAFVLPVLFGVFG